MTKLLKYYTCDNVGAKHDYIYSYYIFNHGAEPAAFLVLITRLDICV
jgi:hypothetical protein